MDQAKKLLVALTPRQLATIVIVAIAVVGGRDVAFALATRERNAAALHRIGAGRRQRHRAEAA